LALAIVEIKRGIEEKHTDQDTCHEEADHVEEVASNQGTSASKLVNE
jgi:hypothetical protein